MIGGLAGSWTMNQFQAVLAKLTPQRQPNDGEDATQKAAEAIGEPVFDRRLTRGEKQAGGAVVHYAFGATIAAIYGAMTEIAPPTSAAWGLPFGAAVWLGADEIGVPLAGLAKQPDETPASIHASALAAHLVYGLTVDAVRRAVRVTL